MKNIFTLLAIASLLASTSLSQAQTICLDGFAGEYACDGYDLYTHFPLSAVGGGDNGNDCWGWVDSDSGREFVLYGRSNGMSVVEITDPLAPSFIANLPTFFELAIALSSWLTLSFNSGIVLHFKNLPKFLKGIFFL